MNIEDRIRAKLQRVDALESENEKLRAALRPFADCDLLQRINNDDRVTLAGAYPNMATLGDFRRAHDVLYPPVLP